MQNANKKPKKTKKFAVIDCETDPFSHGADIAPFLWGFYDGDEYHDFYDTESLVRFIEDYDGYIYAHNGGKFDYHFLLPWIDRGEVLIIDGRLSKMKLGKARLRDSYNILPVSLATYQKDTIDYSLFTREHRDKPAIKKAIAAYCRADCVYTYELIHAFVSQHGHKTTLAGAALALYATMTGKKIERNNNRAYFETFRPYYYGGRVQCFEKGIIDASITVYDINSAYPYAMLHKHPSGHDFVTIDGGLASVARRYPHGFFELEALPRGAFPWRNDDGTKLLFPTDDKTPKRFTVTGWEVAAAMDTGVLREDAPLIRYMHHSELDDFTGYILPLFDERKRCKAAGDKRGDLLAKLFLNSLYGKTGTDGTKHKKQYLLDYTDNAMALLSVGDYRIKEGERERVCDYGGQPDEWTLVAQSPVFEDEMTFYNVATAASITGFVRAHLWRAICATPKIIYCDTDSIICEGKSSVDTGGELGQWKIEGHFTRAAVAGRKLYALFNGKETKKASKGAKLSASEIEQIALGAEVTYKKESPSYSTRFGARYLTRKIKKTID